MPAKAGRYEVVLLPRLKNHWLLAELVSPPILAMAIVPKMLLILRPTLNSLVTWP